ncbi:16825_t:CDS:1, partial [Cetraspora pellucida]
KENSKLVNGSTGIIVGFKNGETTYREEVPEDVASIFLVPIVKFNGIKEEIEIKPRTFQKRNNDGILMVTRKQLPLILSYGITIHKSQGLTIRRLIVDCKNVFQSQQLYVAFSRATDPNNLQIVNFNSKKLKPNKK